MVVEELDNFVIQYVLHTPRTAPITANDDSLSHENKTHNIIEYKYDFYNFVLKYNIFKKMSEIPLSLKDLSQKIFTSIIIANFGTGCGS